jgi:hypothetical protein
MYATKERNLCASGMTKLVKDQKEERLSGDSVPKPLGFIASMPIPLK